MSLLIKGSSPPRKCSYPFVKRQGFFIACLNLSATLTYPIHLINFNDESLTGPEKRISLLVTKDPTDWLEPKIKAREKNCHILR